MSKQELVEAINTYTAARLSGDPKLMQFAAENLQEIVQALDIPDAPEPEEVEISDTEIIQSDN